MNRPIIFTDEEIRVLYKLLSAMTAKILTDYGLSVDEDNTLFDVFTKLEESAKEQN